jgi:hypothetical protein
MQTKTQIQNLLQDTTWTQRDFYPNLDINLALYRESVVRLKQRSENDDNPITNYNLLISLLGTQTPINDELICNMHTDIDDAFNCDLISNSDCHIAHDSLTAVIKRHHELIDYQTDFEY